MMSISRKLIDEQRDAAVDAGHNARRRRGGHVASSAPTHGFSAADVTFDETNLYLQDEPEVKACELTYSGRVDMPAGAHLGPGLDDRIVTVTGCSYDPKQNIATVFVDAEPAPVPQVDQFVQSFSMAVAARYELEMMRLANAVSA
jgi:hypothetical protein